MTWDVACVGKIVEGSPAERSGALHVGDRILSVNSIAVSHLHHEHIVNMIKDSGLTVILTVGPPGARNIGFCLCFGHTFT